MQLTGVYMAIVIEICFFRRLIQVFWCDIHQFVCGCYSVQHFPPSAKVKFRKLGQNASRNLNKTFSSWVNLKNVKACNPWITVLRVCTYFHQYFRDYIQRFVVELVQYAYFFSFSFIFLLGVILRSKVVESILWPQACTLTIRYTVKTTKTTTASTTWLWLRSFGVR